MDGGEQRIDRQRHAQPRLRDCRGAGRLTRRNTNQKNGKLDRHGGNRHIPIQPGKTQIHKHIRNRYVGWLVVAPSSEGAVKAGKTSA